MVVFIVYTTQGSNWRQSPVSAFAKQHFVNFFGGVDYLFDTAIGPWSVDPCGDVSDVKCH